ncbi:hypothetical protein [Streptococcus pluranimalium]|uniref:hypothetical protein n=1 Tax=Streptococcus pluranimalium TaxID=82348 RepID=UPI003F68C022
MKLSNYFFKKFDEIVYRTDMVFVLPMVNKTSVDLLNREFQLRLSKPALRQIYDFSGYYGIGSSKDFEKLLPIISDRVSENSILDSLSFNFTLDTKSPYVRLPNLPSKDITLWYSHMLKNVMKYCIESSCNSNTSYISVMEQSVIYRDKAYKEYFKNYPESTRMLIDYIFKHNYVFPESIIFTSLGSPEKIKFV